jgi:hypothetical protein
MITIAAFFSLSLLLMTVYAHKQNLIFLKNENEKSSV